jgi:hypothetical protein
MKLFKSLLLLCGFVLLLGSCKYFGNNSYQVVTRQDSINFLIDSLISINLDDTSYFNRFIQKTSNYQKLPWYIFERCFSRRNQDGIIDSLYKYYDFNLYLKLFDQLSIDSTMSIDYMHTGFGSGGRPILFSISKNESSNEFRKQFDDIYEMLSYEDSINAIEPIHIRDTERGYFQYTVLWLTGSRFAIVWHSNYGNIELLTSPKSLNNLVSNKDDFHRFSQEQINQIEMLEAAPKITINKDSVDVIILTFNAWQGVDQNYIRISRTYPHKLRIIDRENLVEFNCGIRF